MSFSEMWAAFPGDAQPCVPDNNEPMFENQCAIRLGIALEGAGIDLSNYPGTRCWHGHGGAHVIRAQELANWLDQTCEAVPSAEKYAGATADVFGRQGIIFCRNFWGEHNEGDHIDLWDGAAMRRGEADWIEQSEEVWFWEVSD